MAKSFFNFESARGTKYREYGIRKTFFWKNVYHDVTASNVMRIIEILFDKVLDFFNLAFCFLNSPFVSTKRHLAS